MTVSRQRRLQSWCLDRKISNRYALYISEFLNDEEMGLKRLPDFNGAPDTTLWEETMKKVLFAAVAATIVAGAALAEERYVMITHTQGTDPFWPVVEKGGRDAAKHVGCNARV